MQHYYVSELKSTSPTILLDTNTSRHLVQVLRMQQGDTISLTDGKGNSAKATITLADKRHCSVNIAEYREHSLPTKGLTIAVSFTKNKSRNEWMLEKLTEIGVQHIIPLVSQRTEKEKFNFERIESILIAAMLQSKQYFIPKISAPTLLSKIDTTLYEQLFIAHCEEDKDKQYLNKVLESQKETIIFIGPEGDFSSEEIVFLKSLNALPVSLGNRRLRTETAAIYAATIFNAQNDA
jgi:16S rRNA (uracil1498-N3)-methyltransferase